MITIIFGAPGTGKTSLNTHFLQTEYKTHGRALLAQTQKRIDEINKTRVKPLALPDKPPIFANYKASFKIGYEKTFEPYYINPFYLGLVNENMPTQYLPPNSKVFISEAQRYYNSRKSSTLPDWVSRLYEMHRHYGMEIFLDVQRANLIDLNIKEICNEGGCAFNSGEQAERRASRRQTGSCRRGGVKRSFPRAAAPVGCAALGVSEGI